MSSHREAPEISKDPVADSTDLYAFVSPDEPDTVTIIANYLPLEGPDGGPNFYEFGDDVLYAIHIDNDNDGQAEIIYEFRFDDRCDQPEHVPVQHRPHPVAHRSQLEPPADVLGDAGRHRRRRLQEHGPRHRAGLPAVQHRTALDSRLRRAGRKPPCTPWPTTCACSPGSAPRASTWTSGPSSTSASCGPSSRTTPPSAEEHRPRADGGGDQLDQGAQRAQHRHPGAQERAGGTTGTTRAGPPRPTRSSASGPPPTARRCGCARTSATTSAPAPTCRCRAWATRW